MDDTKEQQYIDSFTLRNNGSAGRIVIMERVQSAIERGEMQPKEIKSIVRIS